ncbi:hypothetical protein HW555_013030 [Spodoptera exigua]|uniref:Uncharacterized protein n=1 Tax=Spodoptera exigua TaxID=7107 RepID=A0A835KXE0_SPOEX|nr:hypothetical protein HW555_013030 [Spodoptera exigua]
MTSRSKHQKEELFEQNSCRLRLIVWQFAVYYCQLPSEGQQMTELIYTALEDQKIFQEEEQRPYTKTRTIVISILGVVNETRLQCQSSSTTTNKDNNSLAMRFSTASEINVSMRTTYNSSHIGNAVAFTCKIFCRHDCSRVPPTNLLQWQRARGIGSTVLKPLRPQLIHTVLAVLHNSRDHLLLPLLNSFSKEVNVQCDKDELLQQEHRLWRGRGQRRTSRRRRSLQVNVRKNSQVQNNIIPTTIAETATIFLMSPALTEAMLSITASKQLHRIFPSFFTDVVAVAGAGGTGALPLGFTAPGAPTVSVV